MRVEIQRVGRWLAIVAILGAVACGDAVGPSDSEIDTARALWESAGLTSYRYDLMTSGGGQEFSWSIIVSNGVVASATVIDSGEGVPPAELVNVPSVEDLFGRIEAWKERDPFELEASFHAVFGYPSRIFVNFEEDTDGDEFTITVLSGPVGLAN